MNKLRMAFAHSSVFVLAWLVCAIGVAAASETPAGSRQSGYGLKFTYEPIPGVPIVGEAKVAPNPVGEPVLTSEVLGTDSLTAIMSTMIAPVSPEGDVVISPTTVVPQPAEVDFLPALGPGHDVRVFGHTVIQGPSESRAAHPGSTAQDVFSSGCIHLPVLNRSVPQSSIQQSGPETVTPGEHSSTAEDGWLTIKSETFEGPFPNQWVLYGSPTWDDESYRPHNGSWSGYCVGSTINPPGPYTPGDTAWMVYGPFSLVGATDAKVDFYRWLRTESNYDYLYWLASVNGNNFYGYYTSGDHQSWTSTSFDLKNVPTLGNLCGRSQVWIAFLFTSDVSNQYEGAYIDDIYIKKYVSTEKPDLTYYTPSGWDYPIVPSNVTGTHRVPSPLYAGTNYIDWAGINAGNDTVRQQFYTYLYRDGTPLAGWYTNPPLPPGPPGYFYFPDYQTTILAGDHTLMTVQDSTNVIDESNENNNRYSQSWTWSGGGGGPYEHVTITSSALKSYFAQLKSFLRNHLSLHDTTITTEYIYSSQSGRDNAEKVRNFIKWAYQNWETRYVLLGGDVDVVPHRMTYTGLHASGRPRWNDTIPCDLYYSGLDGTWDANGNNVFGEPADNPDMSPDVYVGRAPVSNSAEAQRFVTKTIIYGSGTPSHWNRVLLAGFDLNTDPGRETYGETTMEYYDDTYIPSSFICAKVYDSHSGNHKEAVRNYLNQGKHFFIHNDHGGITSLGTGWVNHSWSLSNSDLEGLTNGLNKLTIFTSSACLIGAFDRRDCVMEAFMNAPNGGAVATMSNSRFGWYQPGQNPQRDFTHAYIEKFVSRIFSHRPAYMKDFALGKEKLISRALDDSTYRWSMYALNLFGEPALRMDIPTGLVERTMGVKPLRFRLAVTPAIFGQMTTIRFELGHPSTVELEIYDAAGRLVRTLVHSRLATGRHSAVWDGKTSQGHDCPSGVYVVALKSEHGCCSQKVVRY